LLHAAQISTGHTGTRLPNPAHVWESEDFVGLREGHLQTTPAEDFSKLQTPSSSICSQMTKTCSSELC